MDCVLPKWSDNLLLINQSFMDSSTELSCLDSYYRCMSLPDASKTE